MVRTRSSPPGEQELVPQVAASIRDKGWRIGRARAQTMARATTSRGGELVATHDHATSVSKELPIAPIVDQVLDQVVLPGSTQVPERMIATQCFRTP